MSQKQRNLPNQQSNDTQKNTVLITQEFYGPLPHPNILAQYERVIPGAADRIIKKFESQTDHRQELERAIVKTENARALIGILFAFIIAMTAIVGGIYSVTKGYQFLGGSLSFAGLAVLAGAFLANKYSQSESKDKIDTD